MLCFGLLNTFQQYLFLPLMDTAAIGKSTTVIQALHHVKLDKIPCWRMETSDSNINLHYFLGINWLD